MNKPFYDFVMKKPVGWLAVSFDLFDSELDARREEVMLISKYGLQPQGTLFNRRAAG